MTKVKYYYNKSTLRYEKVEEKVLNKLLRVLSFLCATIVFAFVIVFFAYNFFDSPKEKVLKREIQVMENNYDILSRRVNHMDNVMAGLTERDDDIYRVIFEAEPISENIRESGIGGVNRYAELEKYDSKNLMINLSKEVDNLGKKIVIQSKSYDEIHAMVQKKSEMLISIPSIQPISNKDLKRVASGYGWRIDPHYKIKKFHEGMDFTAPKGTEILTTGKGVVIKAEQSRGGFGKQVIVDHGYGYKTRYAHMSEILVKVGQKVNRLDVIGKVGNTGKSTGPHLHYEVLKNDKAVNPVDYYYNDLDPEEYELMRELASQSNQSFD